MKKVSGVNKVAIIGAGLMGFGIGVDFARAGYETWLYNTRKETSKQAMDRARQALDRFVEGEMMTGTQADAAYKCLHPTTVMKEAAENADYVSESVLESLSLKRQIFADLDCICPPEAILTSNSSNFTITSMVADNGITHPERCCIGHYFQPAHFLPLVEVVGGEKTNKETLDKAFEILSGMEKKPVIISKELKAHVGNRIQGAIAREIANLVDKGVCTPQMIDTIIMYSFGRRMGNTGWFIRNDLIGLDFTYNAAKAAGREPWGPLKELVEQGHIGMESGKGFYEWPDRGEAIRRKQDMELIRLLKKDIEAGNV